MLRRILFLVLVAEVAVQSLSAQSLDDARKKIYYERWSSAQDVLQKIVDRDADNLDAWYWLEQVMLEQKDVEGAHKAIASGQQQIAQNSKLEKKANLFKAGNVQLLLVDGKKEEARKLADQLVDDTKGKDAEVLKAIARANINTKAGDYQYAVDLLEQAAERSKKDPEIYALTGDAWRHLNNGGKAVASYMRAGQIDPTYARSNYSIGKIYMTQNNYSLYLKHFMDALNQDEAYAPALYELFYYYYYRDVNQAQSYLDKFIANTDPSIDNDYMEDDLLYVSKKYQEAIDKSGEIIAKEAEKTQPRIYKLIAYCYDELNDSVQALNYMTQYFDKEHDSDYVAKDFAFKADLVMRVKGDQEEAAELYQQAGAVDTLPVEKAKYFKEVADLYKDMKKPVKQAYWLGKVYDAKENPTNLDIYNWGVANFTAAQYKKADSVFAIYTKEYPEQVYGHLWRAKACAMIDSTMEQGLAVPHYAHLVELTHEDSLKNKALLIQSYAYLGAYEANVEKDYEKALVNFDKILELDPSNSDAQRYKTILEGWLDKQEDAEAASAR